MRVTKNKVALLSAAISGLFALSAQAQTTLSVAPAASVFASEIILPFTTPSLTNAVATNLGFGVSANQTVWIRYDLANAVFNAQVAVGSLTQTSAGSPAGTGFAMNGVIVAQGGGAGQNFIVFQVTANAIGLGQSDVITFTPGVALDMRGANNATTAGTAIATATIGYSVHGSAASASPTSNAPNSQVLLTKAPVNLVAASPAFSASWLTSSATNETVASIAQFTKFCANGLNAGGPGTSGCSNTQVDATAAIGGLSTLVLNAANILDRTGAAITGLSSVGATVGATITAAVPANGDFSAATSSFYSDQAVGGVGAVICPATGGTAGGAPTATTVSFPMGTTLLNANTFRNFCVNVNGTSALGSSTAAAFNGTLTYTFAASTQYAKAPLNGANTGSWTRDGTTLQTPWFNILSNSTYVSRFFFMNAGSAAVPCVATVYSETGQTLTGGTATGPGFSIPANGYIEVTSPTVVASQAGGGSRAAAQFVCAGPTTNIQGRYVITHSSGAVDSGTLLRPGSN